MQSRASLFNKTLFLKNLRNYMPLWAVFVLVTLLMLPLSIASQLERSAPSSFNLLIVSNAANIGCIVTFAYAVCVAMAHNHYLYNQRSAVMLHALPISRSGHYFTNTLSGLLFGLVPLVIAVGVASIILASKDLNCGAALIRWLGIMSLSYVFYFGFAQLLAQLTGNILVLPAVYAVLNFTVVVVEGLVSFLMNSLTYGLNLSGNSLQFLSPPVELLQQHISAVAGLYGGWRYLFCLAAIGLVSLAAAWLLYRRRHLETSGDVVAVPIFKPIFKYCFTFGCALVIGVIIASLVFDELSSAPALTASMIIGCAIGYFGAQMLLKKSVHVFRSGWVGFIVSAAIVMVFVFGMEMDFLGIERRVPDADEVASVSFCDCSSKNMPDSETYIGDIVELHQAILDDDYRGSSNTVSYETWSVSYVYIDYTLKNGRQLSRVYPIILSEQAVNRPGTPAALYHELVTDPDFILAKSLPVGDVDSSNITHACFYWYDEEEGHVYYTISTNEALRLFEFCKEDILAGRLGMSDYYYRVEGTEGSTSIKEYSPESGEPSYSLEFDFNIDGELIYSHFTITARAEKSFAYLSQLARSMS